MTSFQYAELVLSFQDRMQHPLKIGGAQISQKVITPNIHAPILQSNVVVLSTSSTKNICRSQIEKREHVK